MKSWPCSWRLSTVSFAALAFAWLFAGCGDSAPAQPSPSAEAASPVVPTATATPQPVSLLVNPAAPPCRLLPPSFSGPSLAGALNQSDAPQTSLPFQGIWEGYWPSGTPSTLLIPSLTRLGASATYIFGGVSSPMSLSFRDDGSLQFVTPQVTFVWSLSADRSSVHGVRTDSSGVIEVTLNRCSPVEPAVLTIQIPNEIAAAQLAFASETIQPSLVPLYLNGPKEVRNAHGNVVTNHYAFPRGMMFVFTHFATASGTLLNQSVYVDVSGMRDSDLASGLSQMRQYFIVPELDEDGWKRNTKDAMTAYESIVDRPDGSFDCRVVFFVPGVTPGTYLVRLGVVHSTPQDPVYASRTCVSFG